MKIKIKSEKLIVLKKKLDGYGENYSAARKETMHEFLREMERCGWHYYDDRLEAYAQEYGSLYSEETMLAMLADGTLRLDAGGNLDAESVQSHFGKILETAWLDCYHLSRGERAFQAPAKDDLAEQTVKKG